VSARAPIAELVAERAFRALLCAYPPDFRAEYAREMTQLFRDQRRLDGEAGVRFWLRMLWDTVRSAPALRVEAAHAERERNTNPKEGTMRPMAIVAVLAGVIQVINAVVEGVAGRSHVGDGYSFVGVALGLIAAALLVTAGVALLRRGWDAAALARVAAVGCLAMMVLIRVLQPWMSGFSTLIGFGFPIVLMLFLQLTRSGGPSTRMTA
jgi:hypothetical protein